MPPENLVTILEEARDTRRRLCKNSEVGLKKGLLPGADMKIEIAGCGNDRRNGSAYCQPCSDKHKKLNP